MITHPALTAGGRVRAHPARLAAAVALAALALLGMSCGAGAPSTGTAPSTASPPSTAPTGGASPTPAPSAADLPADQVGRAHQAALALIALGTLGAEKGSTDAVRALGERVTTDGRAVDERVRALATGAGIALGDDLGAAAQALLTDVGGRTGQTFDQGWLRAVLDVDQQARGATNAVLASDATEEAKAAARDVLARLDAMAAALRGSAGATAVTAPTVVNAGTGGRAAEQPSRVPPALVVVGALLLATALVVRRRAS
jgi:Domain of unknown function (DUF4142)